MQSEGVMVPVAAITKLLQWLMESRNKKTESAKIYKIKSQIGTELSQQRLHSLLITHY